MKRYGVSLSVRPSVSTRVHGSKPVVAGLLLWARRCAADECGQCHVVSVRR